MNPRRLFAGLRQHSGLRVDGKADNPVVLQAVGNVQETSVRRRVNICATRRMRSIRFPIFRSDEKRNASALRRKAG